MQSMSRNPPLPGAPLQSHQTGTAPHTAHTPCSPPHRRGASAWGPRLWAPSPCPVPALAATAHAADTPPRTSRTQCSGRGQWWAGLWRAWQASWLAAMFPPRRRAVNRRAAHTRSNPAWGSSSAGAGGTFRAAGHTPCTAASWGRESCNPHWPAAPW